MTRTVDFNGKAYRISGSFGRFHVYSGQFCIAFGVQTVNDAENIAWRHSLSA